MPSVLAGLSEWPGDAEEGGLLSAGTVGSSDKGAEGVVGEGSHSHKEVRPVSVGAGSERIR